MAVELVQGHYTWSVKQDEEGHREYEIIHRVKADPEDGPYEVVNCPGLPEHGGAWNFDNDVDPDATCQWKKDADPVVAGEKNEYWLVKSYYSTRLEKACREEAAQDPLMEPDKFSYSITKYTEEATTDMFGQPIKNSAHEQIRGPQNEWDASRLVVRVTQNVPLLELGILRKYVDYVNESEMWGFPKRSIKFSNFSVEEKFRGGDCDVYYIRTLEFEVRLEGFDRSLLDEGNKVLNGKWEATTDTWTLIDINGVPPNPLNPAHFIRMTDRPGNPMRTLLDGAGKPFLAGVEDTKWWCFDDGFDPFIQETTCSGAQGIAFYSGAYVQGPYDTEVDAEVACDDPDEELQTAPEDMICVGAGTPAKIRVKKYLQGDLLTKLNLPTTLGP